MGTHRTPLPGSDFPRSFLLLFEALLDLRGCLKCVATSCCVMPHPTGFPQRDPGRRKWGKRHGCLSPRPSAWPSSRQAGSQHPPLPPGGRGPKPQPHRRQTSKMAGGTRAAFTGECRGLGSRPVSPPPQPGLRDKEPDLTSPQGGPGPTPARGSPPWSAGQEVGPLLTAGAQTVAFVYFCLKIVGFVVALPMIKAMIKAMIKSC